MTIAEHKADFDVVDEALAAHGKTKHVWYSETLASALRSDIFTMAEKRQALYAADIIEHDSIGWLLHPSHDLEGDLLGLPFICLLRLDQALNTIAQGELF
jgi:hypothetical protein